MSDLLIACAMNKEAEALNQLLAGRHTVLATGVGIQRTLPALLKLLRNRKPDLLLFTGSAGQLDLSLSMGDVVLPESWSIQDGPSFACDGEASRRLRSKSWTIEGLGLTMDKAVLRADQRQALHQSTGAAIYDSVTAAVLRVCQTANVPCVTPKIVASTVQSGLLSFWNALDRNIRPLADTLSRLIEDLE